MTDFGKTLGNTGKQAQTFGERMTSGFKTFGRAAVATLGNVGLDLLIGTGIQLAANAWQNYANRQEKALDEADAAIAEHEKSASSLASASSMVESSGERFVELQKGINTATGENKSLTEAEYQEYTTMANSLAETLPGLSNGYNAIGNAKIKAVGSIEDLNAALREQQKVVNNETIQNAHKYAKAYDALTDHEAPTMEDEAGYKQQEKALRSLISAYEEGNLELALMDQNMASANVRFAPQGDANQVQQMLTNMDKNTIKQISEEIGVDAVGPLGGIDWKEVEDNIDLYEEYLGKIDSMQQEAFNTYNKPLLNAYAENSKDYEELSDSAKELMSSYIDSLDYETNAAKFLDENGEASVDKMKNWSQSLARDLRKEGVSEALDDLVNLDPDDMTLDEYKDKFSNLSDFITDRVDGMSEHNLKELTGYEDLIDQMEADYTNAYDAIGKEADKLTTKQLSDLNILMSDKPYLEIESYADAMAALNDYYDKQAVSFENMQTALANATTGQASINTALQNSISSTGLLTDDLTNLQAAFSEVAGYDTDALFEQTASGLRLNRDALSAYQAEQEKNIKNNFEKAILQQNKALEEQRQILESTESTKQEKDRAQSEIADINSQIKQLELMRAQYNGLTSDYSKWMNALSNGEEGDIYDAVATNWQSAKQAAEDGWIGTDEFKRAVDYMYSGSLDNQSAQEVKAVFDELNGLVSGWYQFDDDGNLLGQQSLKQFVSDAKTLDDVLGRDVQTSFEKLEDGTYKATLNAQEFADAWGVSEEVVTDIAGKMRDAGWDVDVTGVTSDFEMLAQSAEEAAAKVHNLFKDTYEYDFNTGDAEKAQQQVEHIQQQLSQFQTPEGTYDYDVNGAKEYAQMYETAIRRQQEVERAGSAIGKVAVESATEATQDYVEAAQNLQSAKNDLDVQTQLAQNGMKNDLEGATERAQEALENYKELQKSGEDPFDIDTTNLQTAEDSLLGLTEEDLQLKIGADTSEAEKAIQQQAETAQEAVKESAEASGNTELETAMDFDIDTMSIDELENKVQELNELKASPNISTEDANNLQTVIEGCESRIDELNGKTATPSFVTDGIQEGASLIDQFRSQFDQLNSLQAQPNVDATQVQEVQAQLMDTATQISELSPEIKAQLGIEGETPEDIAAELAADSVQVPVKIELEEGQFAEIMTALTGEEYQIPVSADTSEAEGEITQLSTEPQEVPVKLSEPDTSNYGIGYGGELDPLQLPVEVRDGAVDTSGIQVDPVETTANVTDVTGGDGQQLDIPSTATITNVSGAEGQQVNMDAVANVTDVTGAEGQQVSMDAVANVTTVNTDGADVTANGSVNWDNTQAPEVSDVTAHGNIQWDDTQPPER